MICSIRARLGGMSEFPLVGQGGLENLVDSLGDVRVRFGQLAKVQQDCAEITEIDSGSPPERYSRATRAHGRVRLRAAPEAECVRQGNASTWALREAKPTGSDGASSRSPGRTTLLVAS